MQFLHSLHSFIPPVFFRSDLDLLWTPLINPQLINPGFPPTQSQIVVSAMW